MFRAYSGPAEQPPPPPKRWPARQRRERKPVDAHQMRVSRQLSRLMRYGPRYGFLPTRSNGYVNVEALLNHMSFRGVNFETLEKVVREDQKSRYHLAYEPWYNKSSSWWIRANPESRESETNPDTSLDLRRIRSASEIPMAVHGTSLSAWEAIAKQPGLHRMTRNYIHLAKGVVGDMVNGMQTPSEVLISIDVARAIEADIKFYVSPTGVILTPGNEMGYLERRFFLRVERVKVRTNPVPGWERRGEEDKSRREGNVDKPPPSPEEVSKQRLMQSKEKESGKVRRPAAFLRLLYHRFFY
ncbi:Trna 2-phosphotransferase 1-like [Mycena venus]|uniref:2'-phosphotransferase n=1 Tax=Mycena venus TaxID=2733690 RepID=A0A8H6WR15_9AGAR|nr:Trna 2-phosphotransferase 1-like [Mycena venus]KAF7329041.1 Trna 2-phosphotransferase 1-like [Mycena venus]